METSILDDVQTLPLTQNFLKTEESPSSALWQAITKMLTPLEYLIFNINMVFLADCYFEYDYVYRAANLVNTPETLHAVDLMIYM